MFKCVTSDFDFPQYATDDAACEPLYRRVYPLCRVLVPCPGSRTVTAVDAKCKTRENCLRSRKQEDL